ncbi:guanine nucleotide exchange factor for Rab-3A-like [Gigantopelta aegis]|uniref:guanine nucleotide exchange factor for Rab-3A-like n=1 Tax=Gigantopelta aegis TaxID=1735272 RepID=UPI001B88C9B9|nr:guanine nucleotide exchange factor for Rab-3A-like [Gigantopelta aegis]
MSEKKKTSEDDVHQCLVNKQSIEGSSYRHIANVSVVHPSPCRSSEDEQTTADRADADSLDSGIGLIDMGQRQPGVGLDSVSSVSLYNSQERQHPAGKTPGQEESQPRSCSMNKTNIQVRPLPEGAQSEDQQLSKSSPQAQSRSSPQAQSRSSPQAQSFPQSRSSPQPQTVMSSISHSSAPANFAQKDAPPATESVGIKSGLEKTVSLGTVGIQIGLQLTGTVQEHSRNTDMTNGCQTSSSLESVTTSSAEDADIQVELRKSCNRHRLKHSNSETDAIMDARRRSQSMAEIKEHAYQRLQEELDKAQTDLRLKDEEVGKLSKVRYQMEQELDDLTASLFEEANKMVQDANVKRIHTEKLLQEATQQIEVLQAEVEALKQLVLTSTPSSPNKHLHPQIADGKEKKSSKPFWKTHRRSTSHHEFTKESRQQAEAQQGKEPVTCKEFDTVCYDEFLRWRHNEDLETSNVFVQRVKVEDIYPCLNFSNKKLSERVKVCVDNNSLTIEPIPVQNSYPRKCLLTETHKLCNYRIRLDDGQNWYSISQMCRNRIASVCDFYTYIRYIRQGLVKTEDKEAFIEIVRLRRQMALTRLGLA